MLGAGLGVSGAVFQSLTRNPLGSPDIIGFSTGAYTGGIVTIIFFGTSFVSTAFGAIVGGILTAALVYVLTWKGGVQGFRLIIVGIALTAMLNAFNTWLIMRADLDLAMAAATWVPAHSTEWVGRRSCQRRSAPSSSASAVVSSPGISELSNSATIPRRRSVCATSRSVPCSSSSPSPSSPWSPRRQDRSHSWRWRRRRSDVGLPRHTGTSMLSAAAVGALLLVAADLIAQHALGDIQLPVGVVTVCIGGIYLIWLLIQEARKAQ